MRKSPRMKYREKEMEEMKEWFRDVEDRIRKNIFRMYDKVLISLISKCFYISIKR